VWDCEWLTIYLYEILMFTVQFSISDHICVLSHTSYMCCVSWLLSRRSRQRERFSGSVLSTVRLSVCLSSKCKKKRYLELWFVLTTYRTYRTYRLFKEPIIGSLTSKMDEIRHLENRHDVIFFCRGWSDLDKISETGAMTCRLRWCGRNRNQM